MENIRNPREMTDWSRSIIAAGGTIALVPTMGFFHDGHLSLMRMAAERADHVVVSLFVNPTQFGPNEDFDKYPRDFERDAKMASGCGVSLLFSPEVADMYGPGHVTRVVVDGITAGLCGQSRPGHFDGVATVVAKLFHIVQPRVAVFGRKDFQQLAVLRRMVADLNWDLEIVGHSIVREADGLAMSSRNVYLSPAERKSALGLHAVIQLARRLVRAGQTDARQLLRAIHAELAGWELLRPEYVSLVDQHRLEEIRGEADGDTLLALAARVGKTRLIDNDLLFEG